jgi:PRTRC genetic system protein B
MISLPPINLNKIVNSFNQPDNFLNQPDLVKGTVFILEGQFIVRYQENQQIITKFLSPTAIRQAFNQIPIDTGFLSEGIVRWGINQNGEWLVKFIPPQLTEIKLMEGNKLKSLVIPLPPLIFMGVAHTYYIWAIKTNTFVANAPLFHAPFPNVYENGSICWGNLQTPPVSNTNINQVWQLFFNSGFNDHLKAGKSKSQPHNIQEKLKTLTTKRHYPLRDLIPLNSHTITVQDVVSQLI